MSTSFRSRVCSRNLAPMSTAASGLSHGTSGSATAHPYDVRAQTGTPVPSRRRNSRRRRWAASPGRPPGVQSFASRRYVCFLLRPSKKSRWICSAEA
jgi:hypothetical protein